jgi:uncharacterized protein YacL
MIVLLLFLLCGLILLLILKSNNNAKDIVIADSSVFMDGRIYDIIKTNFVSFKLIIPSFVVGDLDKLSKSSDPVIKSRSAKALLIINTLKKFDRNVRFINVTFEKTESTLSKIINLAKSLKGKILTKDFNLCKEASLKNIKVLNINDLEAALYPLFFPRENILVHLEKEGSQHNQAICYFDDKTKIIAENAKNFIGKDINLTITSVVYPYGQDNIWKPFMRTI